MKKTLLFSLFFVSMTLQKTHASEHQIIRDSLKERIRRGVTPKILAHLLEVDTSTMNRFLQGKIKHSEKIAQKFKDTWPDIYTALVAPVTPLIPMEQAIEDDGTLPHSIGILLETESIEDQKQKLFTEIDALKTTLRNLVYRPSNIKELIAEHANATQSAIVIAYREEGDGKGAFYDHYTMQRATQYQTQIVHDPEMNLRKFSSYIRDVPEILPYGAVKEKKLPDVNNISYEGGLLFIPGRTRDNEYDQTRNRHEQNLIRNALNRGQPILAICAGSWQLWKAFGGATREVANHSYRGGMIRLGTNGTVVNNKQIHKISVEGTSLLAAAMKQYSKLIVAGNINPNLLLLVNSLHWKAPDESLIPQLLQIAARAVADDTIAPLSHTGNGLPMAVEDNTIEAFESKYGAPLMGIQWHPEAYNANDEATLHPQHHRRLLQFMAKAGNAYYAKRKMLKEYAKIIKQ